MLAVSGETVYVGGTFETIGTNSATRHRIAAIKTNAEASATAEATGWNPNAINGEVKALAVSGSSSTPAGPSRASGSTARCATVSQRSTRATNPPRGNPTPAPPRTVNALAVSGASIVYVGGTFRKIGSTQVTRNRIAAIKTNAEATATAEATSWNPNANSAVNALALSGTSIVYVGGSFENRQHPGPQPHRRDQNKRQSHRNRRSHQLEPQRQHRRQRRQRAGALGHLDRLRRRQLRKSAAPR